MTRSTRLVRNRRSLLALNRLKLSRLKAAALVGCLSGVACTDTDLFIPPENRGFVEDNRLTVSGGFCAEGADELNAFLKIMLIVDRSNSMAVTDPNNARVTAARDLVLRFVENPVTLELQPGVEFAVISFFGDTVVHTRDVRGLSGFSRDGAEIIFAITQLAALSANTGYDKALAQAFLILDGDMARLSDKARAQSRYETIFLSDGLPFPDNCAGEANSPSAALSATERIQSLEVLHKVEHRFHTAFASVPDMFSTPTTAVDGQCGILDPFSASNTQNMGARVRNLLQRMSQEGEGTFTQFDSGDAISFGGFEFTEARRIYALTNFVVSNITAVPDGDRNLPDSDADGLSDLEEIRVGTHPYDGDTDDDGFNDFIEIRFRLNGLDPLDGSDSNCNELTRVDTDGDGLLDCEESFLGTLRRSPDSDADGIQDRVEVLFGTNPNSATPLQDVQTDNDADGGADAYEIKWHTDPTRDDVADRSKIAYRYNQRELPITNGQACYNFEVDNISLAYTTAPPEYAIADGNIPPRGWNRIMLHMAQTPYDDPLSEPLYRMACVEARYNGDLDFKIPVSGRLEIPKKRPSDTWEARDPISPNHHACTTSVNTDCGVDSIWCKINDDRSCFCYEFDVTLTAVDGIPWGPCPACSDGTDNDGDGITDFPYDPDCFDSMDDDESNAVECTNGLDDDGNGQIDWPNDSGCDSGYDTTEAPPAADPECADEEDNDGDGAIDFPDDPGCFAANDNTEVENFDSPEPECNDGLDNDGDGATDFPNDPGCYAQLDLDEDGPAACLYCEEFSQNRPNQCDLSTGQCQPRSGVVCASNDDCRGGVCDSRTGICTFCLRDTDCATACTDDADCPEGTCDAQQGFCVLCSGPDCSPDSVCDSSKGWCLRPLAPSQLVTCTDASECGGRCDVELGLCPVDPYHACRGDDDCLEGQTCAEDRGYCLTRTFETDQCDDENPCESNGYCDPESGWCLPTQESEQCNHNDLCPLGECTSGPVGTYCDQQTFVFPEQFDPDRDCIRARP